MPYNHIQEHKQTDAYKMPDLTVYILKWMYTKGLGLQMAYLVFTIVSRQ